MMRCKPGMLSMVVLAFVLAGCGPKKPPAVPLSAVKPLDMPLPPPPADPGLFAYAKVSNLAKLLTLGGASTQDMLLSQGVAPTEIAQNKPALLFLWDPERLDAPMALPIASLLPVPPTGAAVGRLKDMADSLSAEALGDYTLLGLNQGAVARARGQKEALLQLASASTPFDGLLQLQTATMLAKYGPVVKQGVRALSPMLSLAALRNPGGPSGPAQVQTLEALLGYLERLQSVAVGVQILPGGVEVSSLFQYKQGGAGGPIAAPDLAQFLPPGDVRLAFSSRDVKALTDLYLLLYGPMMNELPELKSLTLTLVEDWLKMSKTVDAALSLRFGDKHSLQAFGIVRPDNAQAALGVVRRGMQQQQQSPPTTVYQSMGLKVQLTGQQSLRKVRGWAVDHYEYKLGPTSGTTEGAGLALEQLGAVSYEVCQVGPYLVYALNTPIDELVATLFAGPGGAGTTKMKAMTHFPAGGMLYADVDLGTVLEGVRKFLPADLKRSLPAVARNIGQVTLFGYDSGGVTMYKARLPTTVLLALETAVRSYTPPPRALPGAPPN